MTLRKNMIKWIKSLWTKIFFKEVSVTEDKHCGSHARYKKSCNACNEVNKNEM